MDVIEHQRDHLRIAISCTSRLPIFRQMLFHHEMVRTLRQFLLVLIAFAFVGGATMELVQAAQEVAPMTMACTPGAMMMPSSSSEHDKPTMPCKGMTPGCIKQMGCVTDVALPVHLANDASVSNFRTIDYWSSWSKLAGMFRIPEPLPPRAI
jgi:hypothetical protein